MEWSANISSSNNMVGLRWYAMSNDWMDCCVYVPRSYERAAEEAIKAGVKLFWDEESLCYGDCIEEKLTDADIPYLIEYCVYDEETDECYPEWEEHFDYLRSCGISIRNLAP